LQVDISYIGNSEDPTKKLLEQLVTELNKDARYKIKIPNSVAFLYIDKQLSEKNEENNPT
jgi:predicted nuclease of restriction endonuclease-like (RecB) superfamily